MKLEEVFIFLFSSTFHFIVVSSAFVSRRLIEFLEAL